MGTTDQREEIVQVDPNAQLARFGASLVLAQSLARM